RNNPIKFVDPTGNQAQAAALQQTATNVYEYLNYILPQTPPNIRPFIGGALIFAGMSVEAIAALSQTPGYQSAPHFEGPLIFVPAPQDVLRPQIEGVPILPEASLPLILARQGDPIEIIEIFEEALRSNKAIKSSGELIRMARKAGLEVRAGAKEGYYVYDEQGNLIRSIGNRPITIPGHINEKNIGTKRTFFKDIINWFETRSPQQNTQNNPRQR
ncbi:hypothetical protein HYX18_00620, partial [Candidatus Woesearchaeota archaeon]|nr:hypothetical protein [Candidatus Woesearchaeota archaeon]